MSRPDNDDRDRPDHLRYLQTGLEDLLLLDALLPARREGTGLLPLLLRADGRRPRGLGAPAGDEFAAFVESYHAALRGIPAGEPVIDGFVSLQQRFRIDQAWVDAFLHSMALDLTVHRYRTLEDLRVYLYGSAEVIGLMMARILDLPPESYPAACHLGRGMQYINFIRDIAEDSAMGRLYMPEEELERFGLESLEPGYLRRRPAVFREFIRAQCSLYREWQALGETGYRFIPWRMRLPIITASDMYGWTARRIEHDPFVVFDRKVRPSVPRLVYRFAANTVRSTV